MRAATEKNLTVNFPGRIIWPPQKKILTAASCNLIDREGETIQHDSRVSKTTTRGPKHQAYARVKSHPRDRRIPASIAKSAW
jgi:hypothetical protein